jgi:hypothetical protein
VDGGLYLDRMLDPLVAVNERRKRVPRWAPVNGAMDFQAKWESGAIRDADKPEFFRAPKAAPKKVKLRAIDRGEGKPSEEWVDHKTRGSRRFSSAQRSRDKDSKRDGMADARALYDDALACCRRAACPVEDASAFPEGLTKGQRWAAALATLLGNRGACDLELGDALVAVADCEGALAWWRRAPNRDEFRDRVDRVKTRRNRARDALAPPKTMISDDHKPAGSVAWPKVTVVVDAKRTTPAGVTNAFRVFSALDYDARFVDLLVLRYDDDDELWRELIVEDDFLELVEEGDDEEDEDEEQARANALLHRDDVNVRPELYDDFSTVAGTSVAPSTVVVKEMRRKPRRVASDVPRKKVRVVAARGDGSAAVRDRARGDVLVRLRDDDVVAPHYLKTLVLPIAHGRADACALASWYQREDFAFTHATFATPLAAPPFLARKKGATGAVLYVPDSGGVALRATRAADAAAEGQVSAAFLQASPLGCVVDLPVI